MIDRYLLNFGDSWAHGMDAGLGFRYADLMSTRLNMLLLDYSIPSTSAPRMVVELQKFLQTVYDPQLSYTALFFVTAQERQLLFRDNGEPHDLQINDEPDYYKKYYTNRLGNFTLNTAIITLQAMCKKYGIQDYYMLGWQHPILWPVVDTGKFYDNGKTNALDIILQTGTRSKIDLLDVGHAGLTNGHPSIAGHSIITDTWLAYINNGNYYTIDLTKNQ
jgi:hypothetical protein